MTAIEHASGMEHAHEREHENDIASEHANLNAPVCEVEIAIGHPPGNDHAFDIKSEYDYDIASEHAILNAPVCEVAIAIGHPPGNEHAFEIKSEHDASEHAILNAPVCEVEIAIEHAPGNEHAFEIEIKHDHAITSKRAILNAPVCEIANANECASGIQHVLRTQHEYDIKREHTIEHAPALLLITRNVEDTDLLAFRTLCESEAEDVNWLPASYYCFYPLIPALPSSTHLSNASPPNDDFATNRVSHMQLENKIIYQANALATHLDRDIKATQEYEELIRREILNLKTKTASYLAFDQAPPSLGPRDRTISTNLLIQGGLVLDLAGQASPEGKDKQHTSRNENNLSMDLGNDITLSHNDPAQQEFLNQLQRTI